MVKSLVRELAKLPNVAEWVEFKCDNKNPERIAEYISGLSNAAALFEKPKAYLVWGVEDDTHEIIGTSFEYRRTKKGNKELQAWLARMINPDMSILGLLEILISAPRYMKYIPHWA
ncbi:MAG TPA: ATP-binding protein [Clostridiales bacterium]|nr:ATP-binding protein [Clostridiales bacterium]